MSDEDRARVVGGYVTFMNQKRQVAGTPSYPQMKLTSKRLAAKGHPSGVRVMELATSTLNDNLNGRLRGLPQWELVESFWCVLEVLTPKDRKEQLGTLKDWRARYEAAEATLKQLDSTAPQSRQTTHALECGQAEPQAYTPRSRISVLAEQKRRADLLQLATHIEGSWWHQYRDLVPERCRGYLNLEPVTDLIRSYETWFVPGLLQTPAYAEAIIRHHHPNASEVEIERRLALRMRRQRILDFVSVSKLWTIIDEEALHQQFGDTHTMRDQIDHLIAASELQRVTIQIMPLGAGNHAATDGSITLLRFPQDERPAVVNVEYPTGGIYPNPPTGIDGYSAILDQLAIEALPPRATVPMLRRIRRQT